MNRHLGIFTTFFLIPLILFGSQENESKIWKKPIPKASWKMNPNYSVSFSNNYSSYISHSSHASSVNPSLNLGYKNFQIYFENGFYDYENDNSLIEQNFIQQFSIVPGYNFNLQHFTIFTGLGVTMLFSEKQTWSQLLEFDKIENSQLDAHLKLNARYHVPLFSSIELAIGTGINYLTDNTLYFENGIHVGYRPSSTSTFSNSILMDRIAPAALMVTSLSSYFFHVKATDSYKDYFSEQNYKQTTSLLDSAKEYDQLSDYFLYSSLSIAATMVINKIFFND